MPKPAAKVEAWFANMPDGAELALEWGRICARSELAGHPIPVIDALLGATAIVHGLAVVTRNASDIARTGAPIVDPWE